MNLNNFWDNNIYIDKHTYTNTYAQTIDPANTTWNLDPGNQTEFLLHFVT